MSELPAPSRWRWRVPGVPLPLAASGLRALAARRPWLVAAALYPALVAFAAARLWPRLGSVLAGGAETASPVLWRLWWLKEVLLGADRTAAPFATHLLGWPAGAPVAGLDPVGALVALPLWGVVPALPEVALANVTALAALAVAGLFVFAASRAVWGDAAGPLCAGALFLLAPSQLAAVGSLPARAVPWCVLALLGLYQTLRRRGAGGPLLAAVGLALAAATSPAAVMACLAGGAALVLSWSLRAGRSLRDPPLLRRALLLLLAAVLLISPLWRALLRSAAVGWPAVTGPSFVDRARAAHPGWALLALGAVGAARSRAARPWLGAALVGLVLGFTPVGAASSWLVALGLAVAAGAAVAPRALGDWRRRAVVALLCAVALVEGWSGLVTGAAYPAPRFLRDLSKDPEPWVVLDVSASPRALFHQVLHRHAQLRDPLARTGQVSEGGLPAGNGVKAKLASLQSMGVRFVIAEEGGRRAAAALGAPLAHEGDGLWVYEVPVRSR